MEIKFEKNDYKFNVRSSCIIKDKENENILLSYMRGIKSHDAFILPGGRLDILENSKEAVERELKEELGINLDCKLVSVEEIIEESNKFHMIEFVYYSEINSFSIIEKLDDGWDRFEIVKISEIDKYDIRPKSLVNIIKQSSYDNINHNINYDWGKE